MAILKTILIYLDTSKINDWDDHSECTAKQENKASYNTYYIVPDLIDFIVPDSINFFKTDTEKKNIHNCKKYCTH